jgi:3'-5' exoribonuclease
MPVTPETSPPLIRVRALPAGDKITGFYLLTKIETKPKKDGSSYAVFHLQDSSGRMEAKMWEGFENVTAAAKPGDVLKVEATADHYRDLPGLVIARVRLATSDEAPDRRAFLPHSAMSAPEASAQLDALVASLQNPHLKALIEVVFNDADFRRVFLEVPGGKLWHHATLGGLAEHTLKLAQVADAISPHYPALNRDLLVCGALLHDVGKVMELAADVAIDYSVEGRLLGHIVQGVFLVERKIGNLPDFPAEIRRQVLHLILSHQGEPEMHSPVKPMTPEAIVLHYLDEIDSKLDAFARVRAATPEGQDFSDYVKLMDRFFYLKSIESAADTGTEDA